MTNHIFRDQAVKAEMDKDTTKRQVDRYLAHLDFWLENDYEPTEEQLELINGLWQRVKGKDD